MKTTLISIVVAFLGLSISAANPKRECCINKEACCLTKEKCCEDKRKPHGRKPHPERPDWEAKKAEFLKKFDKDGDGKISPEEKKAIAEEWKKRFAGRKPRPEGRRPRPEGGRPERPKRPEGRKPRPSKKK